MGRKNWLYITASLCILLLVMALALGREISRQPVSIVLPETPVDVGDTGEPGSAAGVNMVSVTPDTVRLAISTLYRPVSYERDQTVETFWSSGSGTAQYHVAVSGGYTRIDTTLADGAVLHQLVYGDMTARWYDDDRKYRLLKAPGFTADAAQRMPTYETVRDLPPGDITEADYREWEDIPCLYVATRADEDGYTWRYWVSVSSGLLTAAERYAGDTLAYRFTAKEPEGNAPEESLFHLPDGSEWVIEPD